MLTIVGATMLVAATQETAREREAAIIGAVVSTSYALRTSERDVAALIAAEAYRRWPEDARTRSALLATLTVAEGFLGNRYIAGADRIAGDGIPGTENAVIVRDNTSAGVYDLRTGDPVRELKFGDPPTGCCGYVFVRVSDDRSVAVVLRPTEFLSSSQFPGMGQSRRSELVVIDLKTGDLRRSPIKMDIGTGGLDLSPDGRYAAVTDTGSYQRVDLVDLVAGTSKEITGIRGGEMVPFSPPTAITFMSDGSLVIGSAGNQLAIADVARGEVVRSIHVPAKSANVAVAATGDGRVVAAGARELIAVDVQSGDVLWERRFATAQPAPCAWLAIAEPASKLYCADLWGGIEERELETGEVTARHLDPQLGIVGPISVSADGRHLTAFGMGSTAVSRWRLDGTGLITRMIAHGSVAMAGYSPDGKSIITAKRRPGTTQPGELTDYSIWDPETDREQLHIPGTALNVGWAGSDAIVGLFDSIDTVGFLDARTGEHVPGDPVSTTVHRTWLLASGTRLYAPDADGTVDVYDGRTHKRLDPSLQFDAVVESISGTEDASRLAVTVSRDERTTTFIVDGRSGAVLSKELDGPNLSVLVNSREVIAGDENRLTRYDVPGFTRSGTLSGAQGGLSELQVSSDESILLVSASDESVALYDLDAGIRLGDPISTSSPIITPGYLRPDGRALVVNETEGIALWDLDPDHHMTAACRMAGRDLTPEEWATQFSDIGPYRSTCGFGEVP